MWWLINRLLQYVLLPGGVPQHVAFIMDGNRRFANKEHIDKLEGHTLGYKKMVEAIRWCCAMGVRHVSVYAFSIENFARAPKEVGGLMQLAEVKYAELAADEGLAERERAVMRVCGDLGLAPPAVTGAAARLMAATASLAQPKAQVNICFAYTAREEVVAAVDAVREGLSEGLLQDVDVTPALLRDCLRTQGSPPVDLVVRTSGETRLSDFMLVQSDCAHLEFVDVFWPDLSFLDFARCLVRWQRNARHQTQLRAQLAHQELSLCAQLSNQGEAGKDGCQQADGSSMPLGPDTGECGTQSPSASEARASSGAQATHSGRVSTTGGLLSGHVQAVWKAAGRWAWRSSSAGATQASAGSSGHSTIQSIHYRHISEPGASHSCTRCSTQDNVSQLRQQALGSEDLQAAGMGSTVAAEHADILELDLGLGTSGTRQQNEPAGAGTSVMCDTLPGAESASCACPSPVPSDSPASSPASPRHLAGYRDDSSETSSSGGASAVCVVGEMAAQGLVGAVPGIKGAGLGGCCDPPCCADCSLHAASVAGTAATVCSACASSARKSRFLDHLQDRHEAWIRTHEKQ